MIAPQSKQDVAPARKIKGAGISAAAITRRYGAVAAVDAVDLEVKAGEFLSLLGPSGSGKTTLLMMIAGFETASSGHILMDGQDLTHVSPNKRGIGMVFQRYALFPHMSVAENIAFPLKLRKMPREEIAVRVDRALAMVRLGSYGGRLPAQLSGGQQQRVAVARALVFEPPVLLMDEPLGALDKKLREELQIEIKKLHDDVGVTIIYVTHDQEEALTMSDRIAVMNQGRIAQLGTPRELYDAPNSPFVADFIGKMNFLPATVVHAGRDALDVRVGAQGVKLPQPRSMAPALAPQSEVTLAARPEHLVLGAPGGLGGVVETVVFTGAFTTCLVRLDDGSVLHVQAPSNAPWALKDRVTVGFSAGAAHVFAREA